jgi:hypothetical protein
MSPRSVLRWRIVLAAWVALGGLAGLSCRHRLAALCPQGTSFEAEDAPRRALWCKGGDGRRARWIELYEEGKGGTRRQSCPFLDGRPDGNFVSWHPGEKTWVTGLYAAGHKAGRWEQVNNQGRKVAEGEYREGVLIAGAPVGHFASCEKVGPPPR